MDYIIQHSIANIGLPMLYNCFTRFNTTVQNSFLYMWIPHFGSILLIRLISVSHIRYLFPPKTALRSISPSKCFKRSNWKVLAVKFQQKRSNWKVPTKKFQELSKNIQLRRSIALLTRLQVRTTNRESVASHTANMRNFYENSIKIMNIVRSFVHLLKADFQWTRHTAWHTHDRLAGVHFLLAAHCTLVIQTEFCLLN